MRKDKLHFYGDRRNGSGLYGYSVQDTAGTILESGSGLTKNELFRVARRYDKYNYLPDFADIPYGLKNELLKQLRH